ncbi:MAG: hypothetical protein AAGD25_18870 [Cyanobacteria bacterium P01_F01_bin.150]
MIGSQPETGNQIRQEIRAVSGWELELRQNIRQGLPTFPTDFNRLVSHA